MREPMRRSRDATRALLLCALSMLLVMPLVLADAVFVRAAAVDGTGQLELSKTVLGQTGTPTYGAGSAFAYSLRLGCSSVDGPGCGDAQLRDPLPAPIELDPGSLPQVSVGGVGANYTVDTTGGVVTISFTQPLGGGDVGLQAGQEATATIHVRVPPNASTEDNGTVTNAARATQSNGDPRTASTPVIIDVQQNLVAAVSKSVDAPGGTPVAAVPGEVVDWTVGGSNASNGRVDSLVLQDPADGAPDPYQYLALTGFGAFTAPDGADRVQVDWRDDAGTWHAGSRRRSPPTRATCCCRTTWARCTASASPSPPTAARCPATPASGGASITYSTVTRDNVSTIPANTTSDGDQPGLRAGHLRRVVQPGRPGDGDGAHPPGTTQRRPDQDVRREHPHRRAVHGGDHSRDQRPGPGRPAGDHRARHRRRPGRPGPPVHRVHQRPRVATGSNRRLDPVRVRRRLHRGPEVHDDGRLAPGPGGRAAGRRLHGDLHRDDACAH